MILSWNKGRRGEWKAQSCAYPHRGMLAVVKPRPDDTWSWEIQTVSSGEIAGHWDNGRLIKRLIGTCTTVKKAMRECETNMDEALA